MFTLHYYSILKNFISQITTKTLFNISKLQNLEWCVVNTSALVKVHLFVNHNIPLQSQKKLSPSFLLTYVKKEIVTELVKKVFFFLCHNYTVTPV